MFAARYQLYLPSEVELQEELEKAECGIEKESRKVVLKNVKT